MLTRLLRPVLRAAFGRRLPSATRADAARTAELRAAIRALPTAPVSSNVPSEAAWAANANRLRERILNDDPRGFLRWDVISRTMFVWYAPYLADELRYLKGLPDWMDRWRPAVAESAFGRPDPCVWYPASSGNLIHHAFHVAQFEARSGCRVQDMDFVFEFGGGYGSMCRPFFQLGFRGTYFIFDLPEFSALQAYYLGSLGIPVHAAVVPGSDARVVCVSSAEALRGALAARRPAARAMFVATWSVSESPEAVRALVLPHVSAFDAYLIAYQERFRELDNTALFRHWQATTGGVEWADWRIPHIPDSRYLIGTRRHAESPSAVSPSR